MVKPSQNSSKKRVKPGRTDKKSRFKAFAESYLANGGNATQAAVSAGYSEKAAAQAGHRLLKNSDVAAQIAEARDRTARKFEISTERVLREVARLVFVDPRKFFNENGQLKHVTELDDDSAACLSSFEVEEVFDGRGRERVQTGVLKKIKLWDKNSAMEKLMKHLGLFEMDNRQPGDAMLRALVTAVGGRGAKFDVKP